MCEETARRDWRGVGIVELTSDGERADGVVEQCTECGAYRVRVIEDVPVVNADVFESA